MILRFGARLLYGVSYVELDAIGKGLLLDPVLYLHHDLLLKQFLLSLLDLGRLRLLRGPTSFVPLIDHLDAEAFNRY